MGSTGTELAIQPLNVTTRYAEGLIGTQWAIKKDHISSLPVKYFKGHTSKLGSPNCPLTFLDPDHYIPLKF